MIRFEDGTSELVSESSFIRREQTYDHQFASEMLTYQFLARTSEVIGEIQLIKNESSDILIKVSVEFTETNFFQDKIFLNDVNPIQLNFTVFTPIKAVMANYQHKEWWVRPEIVTKLSNIPNQTVSALATLEHTEEFFEFLPVSTKNGISTLSSWENGFTLSLTQKCKRLNKIDAPVLAIGVGKNPYELVERLAKFSRDIFNLDFKMRSEKVFPELFRYIGWCSWDAFYKSVNESGINTKVDEFIQKKIPVKWILIDDGWQSYKNNRLSSFQADQLKFPNGLKKIVEQAKIKSQIEHVGVWHTINGYWNGVSEDFAGNSTDFYENRQGCILPDPNSNGVSQFFSRWYELLKEEGISFTKIDSQSSLTNLFRDELPNGQVVKAYQSQLEKVVDDTMLFPSINCMGMAPENFWLRGTSPVSRTSDDFVPNEKGSFTEHLLQNVFNNYFHGIWYWGDFDMFWTNHEDAFASMVLRGLSGGPIYISDGIGETNADYLLPICYSDGKTLTFDSILSPLKKSLVEDFTKTNVISTWNKNSYSYIVASFGINETIGESVIYTKEELSFDTLSDPIIYDTIAKKLLEFDNEGKMMISVTAKKPNVLQIQQKRAVTLIGAVNKLVPSDVISEISNSNEVITCKIKYPEEFAVFVNEDIEAVYCGEEIIAENLKASNELKVFTLPDNANLLKFKLKQK